MQLIGAHLSFKDPKQLLGIVEYLIEIKGNIAALFVGAPQNTTRKEINKDLIIEAHKLAKANNIYIDKFIVHSSYLVNLANSDSKFRE